MRTIWRGVRLHDCHGQAARAAVWLRWMGGSAERASTRSPLKRSLRINGWQCEVAPIDHHTGGIYESYGRGWLIQPDSVHEKYLKTGKWNKLRLKVVGDEVSTWLNGHQMIYLKDEKIGAGNGFIALQIHDGGGIKVRWRKLRIIELN